MKKILLFGILLIPTLCFAGKFDNLRIGVEGAYPPFSETKPDGSIVGFDIDIANALCDEIGAKCKMVAQDWDGMIPALLSRKFDAIIASMSITEERKKKVNFTKKYYSSPARFIKRTSKNHSIVNSKMRGLKVGVQQETVMDKFLTDNWGKIVTVRRYATQEDVSNDLLSGRLDLMFVEIGPGDSIIKAQGKKLEFVGPSYSHVEWFGEGIGIAIRKQDGALEDSLNKAIDTIRSDGTYDRIQSKYFDYDIYGD